MVTVSGYKIRQNKDGENFITLELVGSIELVQSQNTGKFYATVRRCSIPSTFDEPMAQLMVGSKLDGDVKRVQSDPYEYTVKRTGEVVTLGYTYAYQPPGSTELIGHGTVEIENPGSSNSSTQAQAELNVKPIDGITLAASKQRKKIANTK